MADRNSITLTPDNMQALADRLLSRGVSKLSTDNAEQATDLRVASRVKRTGHPVRRFRSRPGRPGRTVKENSPGAAARSGGNHNAEDALHTNTSARALSSNPGTASRVSDVTRN